MSTINDITNMKAEMRLLWEKMATLEKRIEEKQEKLSHKELMAIRSHTLIGGKRG